MGILFPITQAIGMGFKRREQALREFSNLLGNFKNLYGAMHNWHIKGPSSEGKLWVPMVAELGDDGPQALRDLADELLTVRAPPPPWCRWFIFALPAPVWCHTQQHTERKNL